MKYLKKFENILDPGNFWLVDTDERYFEISLDKIGVREDVINNYCYLNIHSILNTGLKFIFITKIGFVMWSDCTKYEKTEAIEQGYEYKGDIFITKEDIENYKVKIEAKKFNL